MQKKNQNLVNQCCALYGLELGEFSERFNLKEAINILNKFQYTDKNFCYKCMRNEHILFKQVS